MKKILFGILALVLIAVLCFLVIRTQQTEQGGNEEVINNEAEVVASDNEESAGVIHKDYLVGTWQSTDDPSSVRVFNADGTMTDVYEGEQIGEVQTWQILSQQEMFDIEAPTVLMNVSWYMRITDEFMTLDFAIYELTSDTLELSYLSRGNTLSYTKIPNAQ